MPKQAKIGCLHIKSGFLDASQPKPPQLDPQFHVLGGCGDSPAPGFAPQLWCRAAGVPLRHYGHQNGCGYLAAGCE